MGRRCKLTGAALPGKRWLACSICRLCCRRRLPNRLFLAQAIDRPTRPTQLNKEHILAALQVANMPKTSYLLGKRPLHEGTHARVSCIMHAPLLTHKLPVIVR